MNTDWKNIFKTINFPTIFLWLVGLLFSFVLSYLLYIGVIGPLFFNECEEPTLGVVVDKLFEGSTVRTSITNGIDSEGNALTFVTTSGSPATRSLIIRTRSGDFLEIRVDLNTFYKYSIGDDIPFKHCNFGNSIMEY
jgi:hypothetical protein